MKRQFNLLRQFKYTISVCLLLGSAFTACSSDVEENSDNQFDLSNIRFTLSEVGFGEDQDLSTRSEENGVIHSEIVDLGDGLEAEVTIQRDTTREEKVPTRGLSDGIYTIAAYKIRSFVGEMKFSVQGGEMKPISGSHLNLEYGSYKLYCYNDKVRRSSDNRSLIVERDDAETARIGIANFSNYKNQASQQNIKFQMRHAGSRIKLRLLGSAEIPSDISATLVSDGSTAVPTSASFNFGNWWDSWTNGSTPAVLSETVIFSDSKGVLKLRVSNVDYSFDYRDALGYVYFVPSTDGTKLTLHFNSGTVYSKGTPQNLSGKSLTLNFGNQNIMIPEYSYSVGIRLLYPYVYLFSDGTTGKYSEMGNRKPVGIVVNETERIAIALRYAINGATADWGRGKIGETSPVYKSGNTGTYNSVASAVRLDYTGYRWTYDPTSTNSEPEHVLKAEDPMRFPAFHAAANYYDPADGFGVRKWYLPSMREWMYAFKTLGLEKDNTIVGLYTNWEGGKGVDFAFRRVGGDPLLERWIWSSSASDAYENAYAVYFKPHRVQCSSVGKTTARRVRPFVKY